MKAQIKRITKSIIKPNNKLSPDSVFSYWRNPNDEFNSPEVYALKEQEPRSKLVYELIGPILNTKDVKILELGCNVGRNLDYLLTKGYVHLTGIEISNHALQTGKRIYPLLFAYCKFINGSIEEFLPQLEPFDIIFSLATLEHIHNKTANSVFNSIAKQSTWIITIEDEKTHSPRHFPRNYKKEFEKRGFKQIYEKTNLQDYYLSSNFIARVFKKKEGFL